MMNRGAGTILAIAAPRSFARPIDGFYIPFGFGYNGEMKPEEFAKQFFDLWQQSAGQMMRDPAFSQKMLELMQQSGQLWQSHAPATASPLWPAPDDGAGAKPVDELAHRLELCEQRLAAIEILIRQWSNATSQLQPGAAQGSAAEE